MQEEDDDIGSRSLIVQRRSKKNRQTKTQLVFDEQARKYTIVFSLRFVT